jgi:pimeloyl-ACP methyl ester carboxylesterase
MPASVRDEVTTVHGLRLHYRDWLPDASDGSRDEMVLAHGLSSSSHVWDLVAPSLAERYRVVAVDQRGHGESDQPDDGYEFPSIVADLHGLLSAARVRLPAVLVGHSWGASVVLRYAAEHPEAVAGLALVDGGIGSPGETWAWDETLARLTPPDIDGLAWSEMRDRAARSHPDLAADSRVEAITRSLFHVAEDGRIQRRLRIPNHLRILRALWEQRPADLLARLRCPVLVLPARQPTDQPERLESKARQVARAKAIQPRVRVRWFEDTIHDIPLQRPDELAAELSAFAAEAFADAGSGVRLEQP